MFKAPIKMLHPLLTATQEGNYIGTENIGAIPFQGIILAHSNEAEWQSLQEQQEQRSLHRPHLCHQGALLPAGDRGAADLREAVRELASCRTRPCAPSTLEMLARFCVLTRLRKHENSNLYAKMRVYDGESLKETDPRAKIMQEYRDAAGVDEGMDGAPPASPSRSCRSDLQLTTRPSRRRSGAPDVRAGTGDPAGADARRRSRSATWNFIKGELAPRYAEFIGNEIQKAYLESYHDYGQNLFDRYVAYADAWVEDMDFKDPDTGQLMNRELLNQELTKVEKPAGIANPKDFRNEVVNFALRAREPIRGKNPPGPATRRSREVIERRMFSQVEDLLPVISFGSKKDGETEKKHADFVARMTARGYTERQVAGWSNGTCA